jgi:hypothetical protein
VCASVEKECHYGIGECDRTVFRLGSASARGFDPRHGIEYSGLEGEKRSHEHSRQVPRLAPKTPDGVWRHPRYPKGKPDTKEGLSLVYDAEMNGAVLTLDGRSVPLSFGELSFLSDQLLAARRQAQEENSRLWKEKEAIGQAEEGIEPAVYVRGIRQNPPRRRR